MGTERETANMGDSSLVKRIERFFYAEEVPYGIAVVRIVMPLVLLITIIQRWSHAREIYSADGAAAPLALGYGYADFLPEPSGTMAVALISALGFFLVTSSIGWQTRLSLIASTIIYTYLNMLDSLSMMTKYSVIASHVLLILSLSNCGVVWSVDSSLKRRARRDFWPGEPAVAWPKSAAWPRRLLQLLIAIVYFGAAITKMHTPAYFSGDQLRFWAMTHVNFDHPLGEYLTLFPALFVVFAYIAIVWEVVFLFLVWKGWGRVSMLGLGVVFHCMTTLMLGLYIFPMVSMTIYFAFLEERDVRNIAARVRRMKRGLGRPLSALGRAFGWTHNVRLPEVRPLTSAAVFGAAVLLVSLVGIEVEHRMDPYGKRRPEGRYTLKEIDPETASRMLAPTKNIRPHDKILSVDVGTTLFGGVLVNRKTDYRHYEPLIVQCHLNPPHGDIWIECNLHDDEDRLIERTGQVASREQFRTNFIYKLHDSLDPGEYYLVIRTGGQEVARRKITLNPALAALGN
jgi:hypothetical protein